MIQKHLSSMKEIKYIVVVFVDVVVDDAIVPRLSRGVKKCIYWDSHFVWYIESICTLQCLLPRRTARQVTGDTRRSRNADNCF